MVERGGGGGGGREDDERGRGGGGKAWSEREAEKEESLLHRLHSANLASKSY